LPLSSSSSAVGGRRRGCGALHFVLSPLWTTQNLNHGVDLANTLNDRKSTASDRPSHPPSELLDPPPCSRKRSTTSLLEHHLLTTLLRSSLLLRRFGSLNVFGVSQASAHQSRTDLQRLTRPHPPQANFLDRLWPLGNPMPDLHEFTTLPCRRHLLSTSTSISTSIPTRAILLVSLIVARSTSLTDTAGTRTRCERSIPVSHHLQPTS
jgi:hypothetical protein